MNFRKNLPLQLLLCLLFVGVCGGALPLAWVRTSYTISCVFKEFLLAFLPLVIFSYISTAILSLDKRAPLLIFAILALVTLSNATTVLVSYGVTRVLLPLVQTQAAPLSLHTATEVTSYLSFAIPSLVSADKVMMFAVVFGIFFCVVRVPQVTTASLRLQGLVTQVLVRGFIPLLPFYILGFALKMQREGGLTFVLQHYGTVFGLICLLLVSYLSFLYWVGSGFHTQAAIQALRTMFPAAITGFSTMSSAVAMPVTLTSTKKNLHDDSYAQLVIPTTVNIHMMGDALSIPLLTFGVMRLFGQPLPPFATFLPFVPAFCLAKFSLAAIPGGSILVMLPLLQQYFGLSLEMSGLITTLYILQDPLFTCGNVMGNGAFALWSHKLLRRVGLVLPAATPHPVEA